MKLAISTLGCPSWTFDQIVESAHWLGYEGVEFRGIGEQMDLTEIPEFSDHQATATRDRLAGLGLSIPSLGSSARFHDADPGARKKNEEEARAYIRLAQRLGAPCVLVFGDLLPKEEERETVLDRVGRALRALGPFGEDHGVRVLLETHGDFFRAPDVKAVMEIADHPHVGVLWDTHHPYRFGGDSGGETVRLIGPYIAHTHFKDSIPDPGYERGFRYVHFGDGDVPQTSFLRLLKGMDYKGFLTFEHEKRWHPEIPDPDLAFPVFAERMRGLLRAL